jgi:hypothetical protein
MNITTPVSTNPTFGQKRVELINKKKNLQARIVELQKELRWLQDESFVTQGSINWIENEMMEWDCEHEEWF